MKTLASPCIIAEEALRILTVASAPRASASATILLVARARGIMPNNYFQTPYNNAIKMPK